MLKLDFLLKIAILAVVSFTNAHACGFKNNGDGTLTDVTTNVVWQENNAANTFERGGDWYEVMAYAKTDKFLGKNDWRLPTNNELTRYMASGCWNGKRKYFWSADTIGSYGYIAYMDQGRLSDAHKMKGSGAQAALVRGGSTVDQNRFDAQFEEHVAPIVRKAERDRQEQVRQEERAALVAAQAENERARAEAKFQEVLISKSPQKIYLSAGGYARGGEGYRATQLYESIISRFPDSTWAVKASDQLDSARRQSDTENFARKQQYEAGRAQEDSKRNDRVQCSIRIDKCKDSCGSGNTRFACTQRCESICSQF